jgi:hypothetical protein
MSEPSKEAMEKARGIAERQFIEAPTESEQNFVDSIVPEIALEFTNYQKRIEELEKCEKWLLHTEDCMNYSKCRCGLDEFKSQLAKGVKEG